MRTHGSTLRRHSFFRTISSVFSFLAVFGGLSGRILYAQTTNQETTSEQIQRLTDSMARAQTQLDEIRQQLLALRRQMEQSGATVTAPKPSAATPTASPSVTESAPLSTAAAIDDLREQQAIQESQIATQEQSKVESESKYPVKITGLLLLNGFVNTRQVDMAATPT